MLEEQVLEEQVLAELGPEENAGQVSVEVASQDPNQESAPRRPGLQE